MSTRAIGIAFPGTTARLARGAFLVVFHSILTPLISFPASTRQLRTFFAFPRRGCLDGGNLPATGGPFLSALRRLSSGSHGSTAGVLALFPSRPLPERLAALTVARFVTQPTSTHPESYSTEEKPNKKEQEKEQGKGSSGGGVRPIPAAMPLKQFLEQIPAVTRDAMLQSRLEIGDWIGQTGLLELVYQHADGVVRDTPPSTSNSTGKSLYGALRCVRVREGERAAQALLSLAGKRQEKNACGDGTTQPVAGLSPFLTSSSLSLCEARPRAVLQTLEAFLRRKHAETNRRYCFLSAAYLGVMRDAARFAASTPPPIGPALHDLARAFEYAEIESLVLEDATFQERLWVLERRYVTWRDPDERVRPRFVSPQPAITKVEPENHYGGWGSANTVPTRDDVREILRYIPVNWGNLGSLQIPPAVKKARIRSSSPLQWFRRQPHYFEVRNMAGTIEIRRSVALHPEAHGLTPEEAKEQVELAIASGEANHLTPLGVDGRPLPEELSSTEKAIRKFFYRVCPPYFAPLSLVMQRYTKKNLTEAALLEIARAHKADFEIYTPPQTTVALVRHRIGADSSRWRENFVQDLERYPEDVHGIILLMNRLCPTWDRPEYVYVRLSVTEQQEVGGYRGMIRILERHPRIFRVGRCFVCRVDSSDSVTEMAEEPSVIDMTSRSYLREENPYLSPLDIIKVFHYVAPPDKPCSPAFFVELASPAMRVALPPRIITILQQFPTFFAYKETAPGVYSVRKLDAPNTVAPRRRGGREPAPDQDGDACIDGGMACHIKQTDNRTTEAELDDNTQDEEEDCLSLFESEIAGEGNLSRMDVIETVKHLIPSNGVESANLLLWASMTVQHAANHHYGGLIKMVEAEKKHFKVIENADSKTIYRS